MAEPSSASPEPVLVPFEGHRRRLQPADYLFADGDREREEHAAHHWQVRTTGKCAMSSRVKCFMRMDRATPRLLCFSGQPLCKCSLWLRAAGGTAEVTVGRQLREPPLLCVRRAAADGAPAGHPSVRDPRLLLCGAGSSQAQGKTALYRDRAQ